MNNRFRVCEKKSAFWTTIFGLIFGLMNFKMGNTTGEKRGLNST